MNRSTLALVGMIVTCVLWGSSHAVVKTAIVGQPPLFLAALRMLLATPLLYALQWGMRRPAVDPGDRWPLFRLSFVAVSGSYLVFYAGVNLTLASDVSLLIIGQVLCTALFAALWLGEHMPRLRMVSVAIGTIGVVVLVSGAAGQNSAAAPQRVWGDVLVLLAYACEAYFTVRGAAFLGRNDPLSLLAWMYLASQVVWVPIVVWYVWNGALASFTPATWLAIGYTAAVSSALCYVMWFAGVRVAGATAAAVALLFQPVVGATIGVTVLGDPVTRSFVIGGVCVVVALALSSVVGRTDTGNATPVPSE